MNKLIVDKICSFKPSGIKYNRPTNNVLNDDIGIVADCIPVMTYEVRTQEDLDRWYNNEPGYNYNVVYIYEGDYVIDKDFRNGDKTSGFPSNHAVIGINRPTITINLIFYEKNDTRIFETTIAKDFSLVVNMTPVPGQESSYCKHDVFVVSSYPSLITNINIDLTVNKRPKTEYYNNHTYDSSISPIYISGKNFRNQWVSSCYIKYYNKSTVYISHWRWSYDDDNQWFDTALMSNNISNCYVDMTRYLDSDSFKVDDTNELQYKDGYQIEDVYLFGVRKHYHNNIRGCFNFILKDLTSELLGNSQVLCSYGRNNTKVNNIFIDRKTEFTNINKKNKYGLLSYYESNDISNLYTRSNCINRNVNMTGDIYNSECIINCLRLINISNANNSIVDVGNGINFNSYNFSQLYYNARMLGNINIANKVDVTQDETAKNGAYRLCYSQFWGVTNMNSSSELNISSGHYRAIEWTQIEKNGWSLSTNGCSDTNLWNTNANTHSLSGIEMNMKSNNITPTTVTQDIYISALSYAMAVEQSLFKTELNNIVAKDGVVGRNYQLQQARYSSLLRNNEFYCNINGNNVDSSGMYLNSKATYDVNSSIVVDNTTEGGRNYILTSKEEGV